MALVTKATSNKICFKGLEGLFMRMATAMKGPGIAVKLMAKEFILTVLLAAQNILVVG